MKIFLVVGTLFPFDRLVERIDQWAGKMRDVEVIGQIGESSLTPRHMKVYQVLDAAQFNQIFEDSDLIITHAGMGIILKSLVEGKPIVVLPRKHELKETTTDHQMATAKALDKMNIVQVAWTNEELLEILKEPGAINARGKINKYSSEPLLNELRTFIGKS